MSKLKYTDNIEPHDKTKMRHRLRRTETRNKNIKRIKDAERGVYPFCIGYFVKDEQYIPNYEIIDIPASTRPYGHWERIEKTVNENGKEKIIRDLVFVHDGIKYIPAHKGRKFTGYTHRQLKKRPIRINTNLKSIRKMASRKFRRTISAETELPTKGCTYKKYYDVAWEYI